jgi:hypothetical protein
LDLNLEYYGQTNPEGRTRLTRRLIMDLIRIIIAKASIARFQLESTLPTVQESCGSGKLLIRGLLLSLDGHPQNRSYRHGRLLCLC